MQKNACLDDLTTAGTVASGHTNVDDWAGLNATGTTNPSGVPGIQVDGYFPDTSTSNTNNGWNHDSQFVIRLPDDWNGKLVVSGAPGHPRGSTPTTSSSATGCWRAATRSPRPTRATTAPLSTDDGSTPGGSVREWNRRVTQLTRATKAVVAQRYGHAPARTYMFGISNGGYLTRWQLENHPDLYDGGLDWEGTLFRAAGPNLLTYLPAGAEELPGLRRDRRPGRPRRDHRRRLRAGLGVPVGLPLRLLLGPHPAALPRGARPDLRRRARGRARRSARAGRRAATPTTTTPRDPGR